jgi:TonB family protein
MTTRTTIAFTIVSIVVVAGLVGARSAPQQTPRDRTAAEQHAGEQAAFEQKAAALEQTAAQQPASAAAQHVVGTFYYEKSRDPSLTVAERRDLIARALGAEDRALRADPDYVEALVYKNILLRTQAVTEPDEAVKAALVRDADALRNRALELRRASQTQAVPEGTVVSTNAPPPPPPPPPPGGVSEPIKWVYAETKIAASGAAPVQTKHVRPIYAPMVIASGYQGEVVLEATVDARGKVGELRVVRSQPMLTQAAIDAVRQWEFDPATIGAGGTVVTVTATFTPPATK